MSNNNKKISIVIIVAISKNGIIGKNGELPWHISEDLKRFKMLTLNKPVLMGRKTYDSIVEKIGTALPDRENLILTRKKCRNFNQNTHFFNEIKEVFYWMKTNEQKTLIVAGGTSLYKKFLPYAEKIEVTHVNSDFEGDTAFPDWDKKLWNESRGELTLDHKSGLEYYFSTYKKI